MINRDGNSISLWQATSDPYAVTSTRVKNKTFDIIVVGGGITGLCTALSLQEAGKKCLVVEARNLCFGTTGGTTAHINTLLDTPYNLIAKNFSREDAKTVAGATAAALDHIRSNIDR